MTTATTYADRYLTVNGLRLHYLDWGNQGAMPLVLLHGLRSYAHSWDGVSREFADRYRVIAIDQREIAVILKVIRVEIRERMRIEAHVGIMGKK